MAPTLSSAQLADALGVTRSAVSNWISRDVLPDHLKPTYVAGIPYWDEDIVPVFRGWVAGRPRRTQPARKRTQTDTDKLLAYVQAAKKAAAVKGHLGYETDEYWMGAASAYQDIAELLSRKQKT